MILVLTSKCDYLTFQWIELNILYLTHHELYKILTKFCKP